MLLVIVGIHRGSKEAKSAVQAAENNTDEKREV